MTRLVDLTLRELFPYNFCGFDRTEQHRSQDGAKASRSLRITERIRRLGERRERGWSKVVAGEECTGEWMAVLEGRLSLQRSAEASERRRRRSFKRTSSLSISSSIHSSSSGSSSCVGLNGGSSCSFSRPCLSARNESVLGSMICECTRSAVVLRARRTTAHLYRTHKVHQSDSVIVYELAWRQLRESSIQQRPCVDKPGWLCHASNGRLSVAHQRD